MGIAAKPSAGKTTGAKKAAKPSSSTKSQKKSGPKPTPTQHKPKPGLLTGKAKRKPPHLRYTEKELKVPQLNGIRPAGVSKPPNAKKGKTFVDDKEGMNAIMALVMAEKEGNIESKMIRERQMHEVREARRLEMEKRAASKKESFEERKQNIKNGKKRRQSDGASDTAKASAAPDERPSKSNKKRVSFG